MRISEKTVELNFCSQFSRFFPGGVLWFGLTQRQEARAGFDACTKLGGLLLVLQFKASAENVQFPFPPTLVARRFHAPHQQLVALQARVAPGRRILYAFPLIGRTLELRKQQDFSSTTWLLDVAAIPALAPPTTRAGIARKNQIHYVDVVPGHAVIHSEPISVPVVRASTLAVTLVEEMPETLRPTDPITFDQFWPRRRRLFLRHAVGAIVLRPA
jgi:hypothetical protein